jgi:hypothetical protein
MFKQLEFGKFVLLHPDRILRFQDDPLSVSVARLGDRPEPALIIPPEAWYEENEDREDLEAADHHEPDIKEFAERGEVAVVLCGTDGAKARAYIVQCGGDARGAVDQFVFAGCAPSGIGLDGNHEQPAKDKNH